MAKRKTEPISEPHQVIAPGNGVIYHGDAVTVMSRLPGGTVDLVVIDPPYNYGIDYGDHFDDDRPTEEYLTWARKWLSQIRSVLTKTGSFWMFMPDELVSEMDCICKTEFGFHKRSHVIWTYTFGVNSTNKLTRSHAHLLYYVRHPVQFTFNVDACRVPLPASSSITISGRTPRAGYPTIPGSSGPRICPKASGRTRATWHVPGSTGRSRAGQECPHRSPNNWSDGSSDSARTRAISSWTVSSDRVQRPSSPRNSVADGSAVSCRMTSVSGRKSGRMQPRKETPWIRQPFRGAERWQGLRRRKPGTGSTSPSHPRGRPGGMPSSMSVPAVSASSS